MEPTEGRANRAVIATLDHEMQLVREAITMVAWGAAPRVVLGSIRFGEHLLAPAQEMGDRLGVRVVPIWPVDDGPVDLAVEPMPA